MKSWLRKNIPGLVLIFILSCLSANGFAQENKEWRQIKSTHFIIYYHNAKPEFLDNLAQKSEDLYNKIADDLGFRRFDFWLWDNRAKIYIYDDAKSYQAATGQKEWSGGCAITKDKVIKSYVNSSVFFTTVLPHELGHIIFREFVGFDNSAIPLWLDEGVASYQENFRRISANRLSAFALKENKLMNIDELGRFVPASEPDTERVNLFYAESVTIVDYMIKEFGSDSFVCFCQNLRDKKNFEAALRSCYSFENTKQLEKYWLSYLGKVQ